MKPLAKMSDHHLSSWK